MVQILNNTGGLPQNDSGYALDKTKLGAMPPGVVECEPTRAIITATDYQSIRTYLCPWGQRNDFEEWLVGKSTISLSFGVDPAQVSTADGFYLSVDPLAPKPAPVAVLSRIIPAQDPQRPWLFATEVQLLNGEGAAVLDPYSFLLDAQGNQVEDANNNPIPVPCIYYADNDQGIHGPVIDAPFVDPILTNLQRLQVDDKFRDGMARYRVTYRPRNYAVLTDAQLGTRSELHRYVDRYEEYGLEALPLARLANSDQGQIKFFEGKFAGKLLPEAGIRQFPLATLSYKWLNVPGLPAGMYARCLGRVNSLPFDGLRGRPLYPPSTLLCLPWKTEQKVGPTGAVVWDITYRFAFRPQQSVVPGSKARGWLVHPAGDGNFYGASWGGGDPVAVPATKLVYDAEDFNLLFIPPPPINYLN